MTKALKVAPRSGSHRRILAGGALLVGAALLAYFPVFHNGFIWDDDVTLTQNPIIKAGDGLFRFWFTTQWADYWPITSSALWIEWRLWGPHAAGYHAFNLALHVAEAGLLWAILRRLRIPGAYLAALIFAVHPVNVESVAWIAQTKNLMAMLFCLASIWWFIGVERVVPAPRGHPPDSASPRHLRAAALRVPNALSDVANRTSALSDVASRTSALGTTRSTPYWLSLAAFVFALLSKGSVAMLPVVLLGLILWHRRLEWRDALLLAPFFFVAAGLAAVDVWFQSHGVATVVRHADLAQRLAGAGAVVWFYLSKALWPSHLVFFYPQWVIEEHNPLWWLPSLAAAAATAGLWFAARRPGAHPLARPALFAWGYFCVMLVPVMGFTDVYFMRYSLVANHYEHLAIVGVIVFGAALWTKFDRTGLTAAPVICLLAALSWRECRTYRDAATLYRATLRTNPSSAIAHGNLGVLLADAGRPSEAIAEFEEALSLTPDYPEVSMNLGNVLMQTGRLPEAIAEYERALRIKPDDPSGNNYLALALARSGRAPEAIARYEKALQLKPDYAAAHVNLGVLFDDLGRRAEAIVHYEAALRSQPDNVAAQNNLGAALAESGRLPEAIEHFRAALRLKPDSAALHEELGMALNTLGRTQEAEAEIQEAERLKNAAPAR